MRIFERSLRPNVLIVIAIVAGLCAYSIYAGFEELGLVLGGGLSGFLGKDRLAND